MISYVHSCKPIQQILTAVIGIIFLGCGCQKKTAIHVFPRAFNIQVPMTFNDRGIVIKTYWGAEKKCHLLRLDNFSPSWIQSSAAGYSSSFKKSGQRFKTSTADGTSIKGAVGICDSLVFESLLFTEVPFYVMATVPNDKRNDDGVFGADLMSAGVWKLDFLHGLLTFASSLDSIDGLDRAEVLYSTFTDNHTKIEVKFGSGITKTMSIDLGYNGYLLLPMDEFEQLRQSKYVVPGTATFSTPASRSVVEQRSFLDTVKINPHQFLTVVASNEKVKERLVGWRFFKQLDFMIIDFINRKVYLPKNKDGKVFF